VARRARLLFAGVPQHIIQRRNNPQATFFAEEDYRCCNCIECNPVRAQMVVHPGDYRWSSYRCHALGAPDKLLSIHKQYERLGGKAEEPQQAYRELFRSELDSSEFGELRDTVNHGWPLGGERFKDEIESAFTHQSII
jgi:putative transposase